MRFNRGTRHAIGARSVLAGLVVLALTPLTAGAAAPSQPEERAFRPTPQSQPLYGVEGPQEHTVLAEDGVELHVDVWVPQPKGGVKPPKKLPVILIQTPYDDISEEVKGRRAGLAAEFGRYFAAHGFVAAIGSVRGTGRSGGCMDLLGGPIEVADTLRVVEYLARVPAWASGRVGMLGFSYDAWTALGAAVSDDRARSRYLKAVVVGGSAISPYDWYHLDGVPRWSNAALPPQYHPGRSLATPEEPEDLRVVAERHGCEEAYAAMADASGDHTAFWMQRDMRPRLHNLRAPLLLTEGLADIQGTPVVQSGFLDRIPDDTPHKLVIGQWGHDAPLFYMGWTDHLPEGERRSDWRAMVRAWFDRYLMDLPTNVEEWPAVQVQGQNPAGVDGLYGRWREEAAWPTTGGPVGQFALGPDGTLAVAEPSGETPYREAPLGSVVTRLDRDGVGTAAVFQTEPLAGPLHVSGQPSLQLWVRLEQPDAHITAVLEAFDAHGNRMGTVRGGIWRDTVYGARSARHLDPLVDGGFRQEQGRDAPVGVPLLVPIRLSPVDIVVPEGGRVR